jgi:MYXO-CTERM domain-containing protein
MNLLLAMVLGLSSPQFEPVHACDPIGVLHWQNTLFRDSAEGLFRQSLFLPQSQWDPASDDLTGGQVISDCFDSPTPHGGDVVVHHYPRAALTPPRTRPVLLVTGAGDNALRSMSFLAVQLSRAGFNVYSLTFAHRQGDNYQHAEHIANVLQYMRERHPGVQLDVVGYSKGGIATRIYASNVADTVWPARPDYQQHGTDYRGDIGRLILLGTPNAGLDTSFRWPSSNLFSVGDTPLDAPTSWTGYYPNFRAGLVRVDLEAQSIFAVGGSYFEGQSQLLANLSELHPLPGGQLSLGAYATAQIDYLTTYFGGLGFMSDAPGIEQAIEEGGDTIATLQSLGIAADIDLYLAGGGNPIMSVGGVDSEALTAFWGDLEAAERRMTWESLAENSLDAFFPWAGEAFADDLPRLWAGTAFLGEISGPSDGLLFIASALDDTGVTLRGARVVERRLFQGLNHAELPAAGQLAADYYGDPDLSGGLYDERLSAKYGRADNQSVEWIIEVLSGPVPEQPPEPDAGVADLGVADAGVEDAEVPITDAAPLDAAPVEADQGTQPLDQGVTEPTADAEIKGPPTGERFGGTGCQTAPSAPGPGWIWLGLIGLLRLRRRR